MKELYNYAASLVRCGYTPEEASDYIAIYHGLDEYQQEDLRRRLERMI